MTEETQIAESAPVEPVIASVEQDPLLDTTPQQPQVTETKQPLDKKYTDEDLNRIIAKKKSVIQEQARREAFEEYKRQQEAEAQAKTQATQQTQQQPNLSNQSAASADDIEKIVMQALQKERAQSEGMRVRDNFLNKVQEGVNKYPDFEEKVSALGLGEVNPEILDVLNSVPNTSDVLYHIAQNPHKLDTLLNTLRERRRGAYDSIQKMSEAIRQNQNGSNIKTAKEPLGQIEPSRNGLVDSGLPKTVAEMKKHPMFRG